MEEQCGGDRKEFQLLFFDGVREMYIGDVTITPDLQYKPFQMILAEKIGISPNQISIYILDRRKSPKPPFSDDRRRIPVTGKVNFATVCKLKGCCFLAVLKRSRKSRNRKVRVINDLEFGDFFQKKESPPKSERSLPENTIILKRRNQNDTAPLYSRISQSALDDLNRRLRNLMGQKENSPAVMAKGSANSPTSAWDPIIAGDSFDGGNRLISPRPLKAGTAFCEECWNKKYGRKTMSFHPCINDTVITRFSTRFGPIQRPPRPRSRS